MDPNIIKIQPTENLTFIVLIQFIIVITLYKNLLLLRIQKGQKHLKEKQKNISQNIKLILSSSQTKKIKFIFMV